MFDPPFIFKVQKNTYGYDIILTEVSFKVMGVGMGVEVRRRLLISRRAIQKPIRRLRDSIRLNEALLIGPVTGSFRGSIERLEVKAEES